MTAVNNALAVDSSGRREKVTAGRRSRDRRCHASTRLVVLPRRASPKYNTALL